MARVYNCNLIQFTSASSVYKDQFSLSRLKLMFFLENSFSNKHSSCNIKFFCSKITIKFVYSIIKTKITFQSDKTGAVVGFTKKDWHMITLFALSMTELLISSHAEQQIVYLPDL